MIERMEKKDSGSAAVIYRTAFAVIAVVILLLVRPVLYQFGQTLQAKDMAAAADVYGFGSAGGSGSGTAHAHDFAGIGNGKHWCWCGMTKDCTDSNGDEICDQCGSNLHLHNWAYSGSGYIETHTCARDGITEPCADGDMDGRCDSCSHAMHIHSWADQGDGTHACIECSVMENHYDTDMDGICDVCGTGG